jgi:hypothetical protein
MLREEDSRKIFLVCKKSNKRKMYGGYRLTNYPKTQFLIQSRDRDSGGTSNSFTVTLGKNALENVKAVRLLEASIPNTFYNIRNHVNNRFAFRRSGTDYLASLDSGHYDLTALKSSLATAMTAQDANNYAITSSDTTGLITITGTGAFNVNFSTNTVVMPPHPITGLAGTASQYCYLETGFSNTSDTSAATSVVSPYVPQLQFPDQIYIEVKEFGPVERTSIFNDKPTFIIPVEASSEEIIYYKAKDHFDQIVLLDTSNLISKLSIRLFGRNNETLELNGAEWSCILEIIYEQ